MRFGPLIRFLFLRSHHRKSTNYGDTSINKPIYISPLLLGNVECVSINELFLNQLVSKNHIFSLSFCRLLLTMAEIIYFIFTYISWCLPQPLSPSLSLPLLLLPPPPLLFPSFNFLPSSTSLILLLFPSTFIFFSPRLSPLFLPPSSPPPSPLSLSQLMPSYLSAAVLSNYYYVRQR